MRLLQLVLYFVIGYLVWRMMQVVFRSFSRPNPRPPDHTVRKNDAPSKTEIFRETEIKDAEFEDITPPPPGRPSNASSS